MKDMYQQILEYQPKSEREIKDREVMLLAMKTFPDIYERSNPLMHMTASAWILNKNRDKVLMAYHNQFQSFAWLGGHADGNRDLFYVACKEAEEESSLKQVQAVSEEIFSLEMLTVNGHIKHGAYVSSHLHCNVTYLFEADDQLPIQIKPDENSAIRWLDIKDALQYVHEPWMVENVYRDLLKRATSLRRRTDY